MLNLTLKTLQRKGLDTELIEPANFKILPCQGCNYQCLYHKERDCPIKDDDVPKIWEKLNAANAVIFGVPMCSGTIPSLLKILFEGSQALAPQERPKQPQITGVIILGSYGHLNVLAALAPSVMCYPFSKPVGYATVIGWKRAIERKQTRQEVTKLAENVYKELMLQETQK